MSDQGTPDETPEGATMPSESIPEDVSKHTSKIFLRRKTADGDRRYEARRTYYVGVHIDSGSSEGFGLTGNISSGGMFVVAENPPSLGSTVTLDFLLSDDTISLTIEGKVRWVRKKSDEADRRPPGFGVEFDTISHAKHQLLVDLLDELDAPSEAEES